MQVTEIILKDIPKISLNEWYSGNNNAEGQEEYWVPVPKYECLYQISTLGNIKSRHNWIGSKEKIRFLTPRKDKKGYTSVVLYRFKKSKNFTIHKLMAITFIDKNYVAKGLVVDHKNNIKDDNRLCNLQLISNRENVSKDVKNKTSKYTGVSWSKNHKKWRASIGFNKKTYYLGSYTDEFSAYMAYTKALSNIELYDKVR